MYITTATKRALLDILEIGRLAQGIEMGFWSCFEDRYLFFTEQAKEDLVGDEAGGWSWLNV